MKGVGAVPLCDDFPGGGCGKFSPAGELFRFGRIKQPGITGGRQGRLFGITDDLLYLLPAVFTICQCRRPLGSTRELPGTIARILGPGRLSSEQHRLEQRNFTGLLCAIQSF